jgi:putative oxidoreductase
LDALKDLAALVGRVLLAWMYIDAGFGKIGGFARTATALASKGLPLVNVLVVLTIAVELGGGLAIVAGWKTRWAALAVLVFTIVATALFHNFWAAAPDQVRVQQLMFWKNVAVMGGLLVLAAFGPGRYALDGGRR